MAVGGILTFTATYTIEQAAAYTGKLVNIATVVGSSPGNVADVTDVSDDGDDNDGNTTDDPTEIETFPKAIFEVTKTCLLYTSPSPRDVEESRMPSSA